MKILPYKMYSKSAKSLRSAFNPRRILLKRPDTRVRRRREWIINWGNTSPSFDMTGVKMLNLPEAVKKAANKLTALTVLSQAGVKTVKFTASKDEALGWIGEGHRVVARTVLNGHSGRGIVLAEEANELVDAPLYTRYFKKKKEYRVHVFKGEVIDFVEKRARLDRDPATYNPYIRNTNAGWIFAREGVVLPEDVKQLAIQSVFTLGLDFGAVDIASGERNSVVLEVNTAPGLCNTTITKYKEAIERNGLL